MKLNISDAHRRALENGTISTAALSKVVVELIKHLETAEEQNTVVAPKDTRSSAVVHAVMFSGKERIAAETHCMSTDLPAAALGELVSSVLSKGYRLGVDPTRVSVLLEFR